MYTADSQSDYEQGKRDDYAEIHLPWDKLEEQFKNVLPGGALTFTMALPVGKKFIGMDGVSLDYAEAFDNALENAKKDVTATQTLVRIKDITPGKGNAPSPFEPMPGKNTPPPFEPVTMNNAGPPSRQESQTYLAPESQTYIAPSASSNYIAQSGPPPTIVTTMSSSYSAPWTEDMVWKMFKTFPLDEHGKITKFDLKEALAQRSDTMQAFGCTVDELFSAGDDDRMIGWDEFCGIWRNRQGGGSPLARMRSISGVPVTASYSYSAQPSYGGSIGVTAAPTTSTTFNRSGVVSPRPMPGGSVVSYSGSQGGSIVSLPPGAVRVASPPRAVSPPRTTIYSSTQISPVASGYMSPVQGGISRQGSGTFPRQVSGGSTTFQVGSPMHGAEMYSEFEIILDKSTARKLGVDVDPQNETTLIVMNVNQDSNDPGLVEEWNMNNPDKAVRRGDKIVEVNGVRGNVFELRSECKKNQVLNIKLHRRTVSPGSTTYAVPLTASMTSIPTGMVSPAYPTTMHTPLSAVPSANTLPPSSPTATYAAPRSASYVGPPSPIASYRSTSPVASYRGPVTMTQAPLPVSPVASYVAPAPPQPVPMTMAPAPQPVKVAAPAPVTYAAPAPATYAAPPSRVQVVDFARPQSPVIMPTSPVASYVAPPPPAIGAIPMTTAPQQVVVSGGYAQPVAGQVTYPALPGPNYGAPPNGLAGYQALQDTSPKYGADGTPLALANYEP
eukprot:gnl/TRDRNA2_/TRDRNA2_166665_c0_seq2.p1 gnl/TRDRNA2_/TRDRNA2_166665_c0~~gnl/TRDRNA2_/TRDRNA2_166665_c0_seq2.p1  ORF type:complete len:795 (-),score=62.15 gnl/TRDRNA2_/TRDRNA2_166665_c0_seq2:80-2254(-)